MSSNYFSFNCLTPVSILIDLLYCIGSNNMRKSIHFNIKIFLYSHNKLSKIMINTINLYFSFQGLQADWYFLILASWSPLYLFRCQYVVKGLKFNKSFYVLSPKRFTKGKNFPYFGNWFLNIFFLWSSWKLALTPRSLFVLLLAFVYFRLAKAFGWHPSLMRRYTVDYHHQSISGLRSSRNEDLLQYAAPGLAQIF